MMEQPSEEAVYAAARRTVESSGAVHGAVLFGSRARGDEHPMSDWDIAIVTRGERDRGQVDTEPLYELEGVSPLMISAARLYRYANRAGRIEAAIVRQGKVIAGTWNRPRHRTGRLKVNNQDLKLAVNRANDYVEYGLDVFRKFEQWVASTDETASLGRIETASQQMAENVAKAIITGFGVQARPWHNLDGLGEQLQTEGLEEAKDARERLYFGQRVRELDGLGHALHMAEYNDETLEPKSDTVRRMVRAMKAYAEWLSYCAGKRMEGSGWVGETRDRLEREVKKLLNNEDAKWLVAELVEAGHELVQDCQLIGEGKPVKARNNATELAAASWIRAVVREWEARDDDDPLEREWRQREAMVLRLSDDAAQEKAGKVLKGLVDRKAQSAKGSLRLLSEDECLNLEGTSEEMAARKKRIAELGEEKKRRSRIEK